MKTAKITSKLFKISCKSSNELLARLVGLIVEKGYKICTLSQAVTDMKSENLITLDLEIPGQHVDFFMDKIRLIDGVCDITVSFGSVLQMATYQIKFDTKKLELLNILKSHNTQIIHIEADMLLILHIATEKDIQVLYNKLDNAQLIGFSQITIPVGQSLISENKG